MGYDMCMIPTLCLRAMILGIKDFQILYFFAFRIL
jgi:hypothetical protein